MLAEDGYESSSSTDSNESTRHFSLRPPAGQSAAPSRSPSRSPLIPQFSFVPSSPYISDAESDPTTPFLRRASQRDRWWADGGRAWWTNPGFQRRRRRRRDTCSGFRATKRALRVVIQHPLFPTSPISILLTLVLLTLFAIFVTLLLIHILNPDKEPLPWRGYCTMESPSTLPPAYATPPASTGFPPYPLSASDAVSVPSLIMNPVFPPLDFDDLPPAGVFVGVFSMDSALERRMLIRNTWAGHHRSRNGAGAGDDGLGTSRTIVRFILGKPRSAWERRIQLESEMYNDIVVLPVAENMNSGKTHQYFTWASTSAWVPPLPQDFAETFARMPVDFPYSNVTASEPQRTASHDPMHFWKVHMKNYDVANYPWVRPDFVLKVDDDSFVMLAELEARLRVELYGPQAHHISRGDDPMFSTPSSSASMSSSIVSANSSLIARASLPSGDEPLVYWGYLVKNQFMAGELYGLSWTLVEWVAQDPVVRGMTRGKEDKQVAKWMRLHPRAELIRWKSQRCWIYDHPRAGTVYSHGFLFPSEVTRVRQTILSQILSAQDPQLAAVDPSSGQNSSLTARRLTSVEYWSRSTVSTFGLRYSPPVPDLSVPYSIEALIEGSQMSQLRDDGPSKDNSTPDEAWKQREGRLRRYENKRLGGTIVVHFIKKNPWYLETALALLEGDDITGAERYLYERG